MCSPLVHGVTGSECPRYSARVSPNLTVLVHRGSLGAAPEGTSHAPDDGLASSNLAPGPATVCAL